MTALEPATKGIGGHQASKGVTDEWLTPPALLAALGPFDLDPCAATEPRPWPTAERHICRPADGLSVPWQGRVWVNPPYSKVERWMARLAGHGTGTALVFARTETSWFHAHVWRSASAVLFLEGRLTFYRTDGRAPEYTAGGPSALVAYGADDAERLERSGIAGALVRGWASYPPARADEGLFQ